MPKLLMTGNKNAPTCLLLAHGAGAPATSPFMETMVEALGAHGLQTARFEFAYMAARRTGGPRRPPPKADALMQECIGAVDAVRMRLNPAQRLVIGGKSMGGRVASLCADGLFSEGKIAALVCLGYPFHAPGKVQYRTAHLLGLKTPTLIVQGERDPFGTRAQVEALKLSPVISLAWMSDGDHDLRPRARSGVSAAQNLASAAQSVADFATSL